MCIRRSKGEQTREGMGYHWIGGLNTGSETSPRQVRLKTLTFNGGTCMYFN